MGLWSRIKSKVSKETIPSEVPFNYGLDIYEEPTIIGSYGTLTKSKYDALLKEEKTLKLYHDLWRAKIVKLVQEKIELIGNHSGYHTWFLYSMYGLYDVEFRGGIHLLSFYQYHTKEFVKLYPKLKAEVYLLRLKRKNETITR